MNASANDTAELWATQLTASPATLLNQLLHLDQVHLIIRSSGLSIAKWTEFGIFFNEGRWLQDPVSDVAIEPNSITKIYVAKLERMTTSILFETGSGISMEIQCDSKNSNLEALNRIRNAFQETPCQLQQLRSLGGGSWLDDWQPCDGHCDNETARKALRRALANRDQISVGLGESGLAACVTINPSFLDFDGCVARFADPNCECVVVADIGSPEISIEEDVSGVSIANRQPRQHASRIVTPKSPSLAEVA